MMNWSSTGWRDVRFWRRAQREVELVFGNQGAVDVRRKDAAKRRDDGEVAVTAFVTERVADVDVLELDAEVVVARDCLASGVGGGDVARAQLPRLRRAHRVEIAHADPFAHSRAAVGLR